MGKANLGYVRFELLSQEYFLSNLLLATTGIRMSAEIARMGD